MNNPLDLHQKRGQTASHIVVSITSHGYGHAAMTAPLINRLQTLYPELKITLRTEVPLTFLKSKFKGPFEYLPRGSDFGMLMNSAFEVDRPRSLQAYREFHGNWEARVAEEHRALATLTPDMVISNIAYLPIIAARQAGIPSVAISCLNWADMFHHYFPNEEAIHRQIVEAYRSADLFIRTEPAMPMEDFVTRSVGPLIGVGNSVRQELLSRLELTAEAKIVLVSMGGIKTEVSADLWPRLEGVHYIAANPIQITNRQDVTRQEILGLAYNDLLRSCDLLLTKPGYGSFTEAALSGTPVLYVNRNDWPEQPYSTLWLQNHVACREISQERFTLGQFGDEMEQLLRMPHTSTPPLTGMDEAAGLIGQLLGATVR